MPAFKKRLSAKDEWFNYDDRGSSWLKDQAVLAVVAMSDSDPVLRQIAVDQIEDESVLIHVALNDMDRYVRLSAIERIDDQSTLLEIAEAEKGNEIRQAALKRLSTTSVPQKEEIHTHVEIEADFTRNEKAMY